MTDIDKIEKEFREGVADFQKAVRNDRPATSLLYIMVSMMIPMMKLLVYIARK